VAVSLNEVSTGLMFRTTCREHGRVLFVFGGSDQRSFYMKNCVVALSAPTSTRGSDQPDRGPAPGRGNPGIIPEQPDPICLEMPQGWFERHRVTTGMVVTPLKACSRTSWRLAVKPMISRVRSEALSPRRCNTFPGVSIRRGALFAPWGPALFVDRPKGAACGTSMATNIDYVGTWGPASSATPIPNH